MTHPLAPQIWPETPLRHKARAILTYIADDHHAPGELRDTALDALTELDGPIPVGAIPAFVWEPAPGTFADVWALFEESFAQEMTIPERISMALAARLLRPWVMGEQ